jgi:hypothetical protein
MTSLLVRFCNQSCPDYHVGEGFRDPNFCENDYLPVILPDCRLNFSPISSNFPTPSQIEEAILVLDSLPKSRDSSSSSGIIPRYSCQHH